ncbi:MAG: nucleoporin [Deltaproteobacteria bacterium]|nr:nucleoporin [Deltaproteobacteria bacterium]
MAGQEGDGGNRPPPKVGTEAFGHEPEGRPTGSEAFGGAEPARPLKGALLFGNDPKGNPTGADAFGGSEQATPLKGALLFGNDPQGNPSGAESFGGSEQKTPLKGALLFGNDPQGLPTGSEAFGGSDPKLSYRGSEAFGAPQLVEVKLVKDEIGYDFGGVMLKADESGIAGIKKDPRDRVRERVVKVLTRRLRCDAQHLRHGLSEDSIPWGALRRDRELDRALAEELRQRYRRAPGEVLGIGHVSEALEWMERMHTFNLLCDWDTVPVHVRAMWRGKAVATAVSAIHKEHNFFIFTAVEGGVVTYVDQLQPGVRGQTARIRGPEGQPLATVTLVAPAATAKPVAGEPLRFKAMVHDARGLLAFEVREERATPGYFLALFLHPQSGDEVGRLEDRLKGGKISAHLELDVRIPKTVAWGVGMVLAELARLRRNGWPEGATGGDAPDDGPKIETIEEALGPRRRRS